METMRVPSNAVSMLEPIADALVPPFAMGRTPVTSVVSATCENEMVVPSVLRSLFAVPPLVRVGAPLELVTRAEVLAVAREVSVSAELVYRSGFVPPKVVRAVPPFATASVPVIVESVVVATHPGIPLTTASTCPPVPIPSLDHALVPEP